MSKRKLDRITCRVCDKEKMASKDFYSTKSAFYNTIGRIDICKDCIMTRYSELLTLYDGETYVAFKHLCMNLDVYFSEELYIELVNTNNFIGEYFRLLNSRKNTRDKTSLNNKLGSNETHNEITLKDGVVSADLILKWGEGYTASEYNRLEMKFKTYAEHYPNKRLQEQEIIKQLCELEIMKENCRKSADRGGYDKICTQIRKTMDDLRVLPRQSAEEDEQLTVDYIIKLIEFEEPIPSCHPEFDDVNGIEKMIDKYFVKPFKRVMGLADRVAGGNDEKEQNTVETEE